MLLKDVQKYQKLIFRNTAVKSTLLLPEIKLHLIDKSCPWYFQSSVPELRSDPFWSVFWPGGQVLSRFIIDNPCIVKERAVLDIGSGCGALGISSSFSGAKSIICNDIDPIANISGKLNCNINKVKNVLFNSDNIILDDYIMPEKRSVIFLGDMFYDEDISQKILKWCQIQCSANHDIYIGDPGRFGFEVIKKYSTKIVTYKLNDEECDEFDSASVYKLNLAHFPHKNC